MSRRIAAALAAATTLVAPAGASVVLLANGTLGGTSDLSGLTGSLENGLPANVLGGLGSGLAYAGGNHFIALPDRGPNAKSYNSAVDYTVSYIPRFHDLTLTLTANTNANPNGGITGLPFTLGATLDRTTLLYSTTPLNYGSGTAYGLPAGDAINGNSGKYYFSGRSDNYGAGSSANPANARFDPESVRLSPDGKSAYISDEYGPYIRQFDTATGQLTKTFALPANLAVANPKPQGDDKLPGDEVKSNTSGRVANKGMEGLALTPDGKTLVGIMQAALIQDKKGASNLLRIVTVDVASGATHEYAYSLTTGSGVSEIVAIDATHFLVDERDGTGLGDGSDAKVKQIFEIDLTGATDVTNLTGADALAFAVKKSTTPFLDLVAALTAKGVPAGQIPSKIEGLALGSDVTYGSDLYHTLYIANDNDFQPDQSGGNQFFVFGYKDGDLPFAAAVPEPASWATMIGGFALVGGALRRRRVAVRFA